MEIINSGKRNGRLYAAYLAKERMLDSGGKVLCVTPEGTTIQKRHKHLTSIETVKPHKASISVESAKSRGKEFICYDEFADFIPE